MTREGKDLKLIHQEPITAEDTEALQEHEEYKQLYANGGQPDEAKIL